MSNRRNKKIAGDREIYCLFTPCPNMPTYALHRWRMRGTTVIDTLDIEEFRCSRFVLITGRLEPVPPASLIARVDALVRDGIDVNVPLGWRAPSTVSLNTRSDSGDGRE